MIKFRSIADSADCPFYTLDTDNQKQCFVKFINSINVINGTVESPNKINQTQWNFDCEGNWGNCCFVSLLYDLENVPTTEYTDQHIDDYSPFEEETEEESVEPQEEPQEEKSSILVRIHQVSNPYLVKGDVLVYPTNKTLSIDDPELNRMSRFQIQEECDTLAENLTIKMGSVYETSNGGAVPGGVVAKHIYHAVVAGESRLVSQHIDKAVTQSLLMADKNKAKIVIMTPFDCGMVDVGETARAQLTAIYSFINKAKITNIERIYIVMTDDISVRIFTEYFERIFG